jgi:hypothetical protein
MNKMFHGSLAVCRNYFGIDLCIVNPAVTSSIERATDLQQKDLEYEF